MPTVSIPQFLGPGRREACDASPARQMRQGAAHFRAFDLDGFFMLYFAGTSSMLLPPFAMGMTQSGVATSAEPYSVV